MIRTSDNAVIATVPVGSGFVPTGVAVAPDGIAYVTMGNNELSVISLGTPVI